MKVHPLLGSLARVLADYDGMAELDPKASPSCSPASPSASPPCPDTHPLKGPLGNVFQRTRGEREYALQMLTTLLGLGKHVDRLDQAAVGRIIGLPDTVADDALHSLSVTANKGLLWLGLAGAVALRGGTPRRAAAQGLLALGVASSANLAFKAVLPTRPRPEHLTSLPFWPPEYHGTSLPSGHSASAAPFATGVALVSPALGAVIAPVAAGVAYSRVHIGAHWPSDVILGSALGISAALLTRNWHPWASGRP